MDKSDERFKEVVGRIRKGDPGNPDGRRGGGLLLPQDLGCVSHGNVLPSGLGALLPTKLVPLPCGASLALDSKERVVGVGTPPGGTRVAQSRSDIILLGDAVTAAGRALQLIGRTLANRELYDSPRDALIAGECLGYLDRALQRVEGILVREVGPLPPGPGEESTGDAGEVRPEIRPERATSFEEYRDGPSVGPGTPEPPE